MSEKTKNKNKNINLDKKSLLSNKDIFLQKLFDDSRDGFVLINLKGGILDCNKAFSKMLGYSKAELKKKTFQQLTPKKWLDWEQNEIVEKKIIEKGYSGVYEKEYIRKSGKIFPVELSSFVINDEDKKPLAMWGIARDISEKKALAQKLKHDQEKYKNLVENSNEAIVVIQNGKFVFHNQRTEEISGYSKKELRTMSFLQLVDLRDQKMVIKIYQDRLAGRKVPSMYHFRVRKKNKKMVWVQISSVKINWEGQLATLSFLLDVTEAKLANDKIKQAKDRAEQYLNIAETLIVGLDLEGNIMLINKKGEELLGYKKEALLNKNWFEVAIPIQIRGRMKSDFKKMLKQTTFAKDLRKDYENEVLTKKNKRRILIWNTALVFDKKKKLVGVLSSGKDITKEKQLAQKAKGYIDDVQMMNKLMIGREMKMIELKEKIKSLENKIKKYENK